MTAAHEPLTNEVSTPQGAGWLARAHHGSIVRAAQVERQSWTWWATETVTEEARRRR